ncbi:MAG: hypothetical protein KDA36_02665 [Planctomycetaceae bacterium]|nr:hypothetical protein [Planctomycetaceae bacterium]
MPKVVIEYCSLCHFAEPARALAERISREFNLDCSIRPGFWGTYRIVWGEKVIFNRWTDRGLLGWMGFGTNITSEEVIERLVSAGAVRVGIAQEEGREDAVK